jgi:diketogulonate reductase-like aldo/keto reductase
VEVGYRHIDTAERYGNEKEVGAAVRASGLDRADIFVTSKLGNGSHRPDDCRRAFDGTLSGLGFDYVDPGPDFHRLATTSLCHLNGPPPTLGALPELL